ncbi:MAG: hypothetical protein EOS79_22955 [Mesorhizobium sp.]|uniref:hypothetical protein n=1 Tax=Mesorhizobium sp. TaxID=1871066 RepID=UPI000FEAAD3F|nr:hypothetical protein [Mesorhizobium sp.]RWE38558.1 MAG: hypothetical protein EOS79_22955 [Mesorhizobium sp.]
MANLYFGMGPHNQREPRRDRQAWLFRCAGLFLRRVCATAIFKAGVIPDSALTFSDGGPDRAQAF